MSRLKFFVAVAVFLGAVVLQFSAQAVAPSVEKRSPEARNQTPAFVGQTRITENKSNVSYRVLTFASGLVHPWGLAFLPDGRALVTERPGRLRMVDIDGRLSALVSGVPEVVADRQAGLLDVAVDPAFSTNRRIYLSYVEPRGTGSGITVLRARLVEGSQGLFLTGQKLIFSAEPSARSNANMGSRLVFAPDGNLFITVGDRFSLRDMAQDLDNDLGKIIRITTDGKIPPDNPFAGVQGARSGIWSYGHRNPQGAAIDPHTGMLWIVEHGARGGDELNLSLSGRNYGWPAIAYGVEYSGAPIGAGMTQKDGMEQPVYYWDPVIAPSGMTFYEADLFPEWKGSLFVGGLRGMHLDRLVLQGEKVVGEERLLTEVRERIRDVRVGPEGALYVLTDNVQGRILKIVPAL